MTSSFLKSALLSGLPRVRHGFFTRMGGVSGGIYTSLNCGPGSADVPEAVAENRRRVVATLGHPAVPLLTLHQVHGDQVRVITRPPGPAAEADLRPKADGFATRLGGVALGILTADCVPVLFAEPEAGVIGACHAGWRGAVGGILETTLAAMTELGAVPARIRAAIGPAIRQPNYEVGPEFPGPILASDPANRRFFMENPQSGRLHFDLPAYVAQRLSAAGLRQIDDLGRDTFADPETFFSYRRSRHEGAPDYGRQVSVVLLDLPS